MSTEEQAAPAGPVPPRSRLRAHVVAVVVGLVLTPIGLLALAYGAPIVVTPGAAGPSPAAGWGWVVLGAALLAVVATAAALASSLALVVAGLWAAVPGLAGGTVATAAQRSDSLALRSALAQPAATGALLAVGAALLGAALAAHLARRAGRHQERALARPAASPPGFEDLPAAPTPPLPPRTRVAAHALSTLVALALTPPTIWLLGRAANDLSLTLALTGAAHPWREPWLLLACLLLVVVLALAAWSSLGPQLAGWLMYLLPTAAAALATLGQEWLLDLLWPLIGTVTVVSALGTGELLLVGVVVVLGAGAAHWARRSGRRLERAELALVAA
ncbi:hypothetical protein [Georgenia ruanii]|uniref:hypothetical protein n=1 Tax=Georgenia ruanii TaxID=348442 RepID=UPI001264FF06|nr:hypothetical protein [Georgenia ruanii]